VRRSLSPTARLPSKARCCATASGRWERGAALAPSCPQPAAMPRCMWGLEKERGADVKTGPITVTIYATRRRTYWAAVCLFAVCTMLGMSGDRAARSVVRLGYRLTLDEQ